MATDDPFEPKLGKIGNSGAKGGRSFRSSVLHATGRSGGLKSGTGRGSAGAKRGRGAGIGRVLAGRGGGRRVIVKARYVNLRGKGLGAASAHLKYIQRDGVTREGDRGQLYGPDSDRVDGKAFLDRSAGDQRQFRFIVSPEDGQQYDDLKPLTRKLMTQMETDLGTKLDWVAVDHFNTGHPHTHIVIRGRDDTGGQLEIAKEYIGAGFRARAEALVTLDLGPASDLEITARLKGEVHRAGFTTLDRILIREASNGGVVRGGHRDPEFSARRTGRLVQLQTFGLATDLAQGEWRLHGDVEPTLRRMGERGDIIKALHHDLKRQGLEHAAPDAVIHDGANAFRGAPLTGRVVSRGLSDEHADRHYLIVEAIDGHVHYFDIGQADKTPAFSKNAIVRLTLREPELRPSDHTIARVASANEGRYDVAAHLKFDRNARQSFAETHVRRLEAIRRTTDAIKRLPSGTFEVGTDYLVTAHAYEVKEAGKSPLNVEVLSGRGLSDQIRYAGVTWLDQELVAGRDIRGSRSGFGKAVQDSLTLRQQWLIDQELASDNDGRFVTTPGMLDTLKRREIMSTGERLARQMGKLFHEVQEGDRVSGMLGRKILIGDDAYGVLERSRDFALVPWRPVLEKQIGREILGMVRDSGINWTIGRDKGLEIE